MNPEAYASIFLGHALGVFLKFFFVLLALLHFIFTLVVVRQTKMMLRVVEAKISPVIYSVAVVHALYSFFVLLYAALFL